MTTVVIPSIIWINWHQLTWAILLGSSCGWMGHTTGFIMWMDGPYYWVHHVDGWAILLGSSCGWMGHTTGFIMWMDGPYYWVHVDGWAILLGSCGWMGHTTGFIVSEPQKPPSLGPTCGWMRRAGAH